MLFRKGDIVSIQPTDPANKRWKGFQARVSDNEAEDPLLVPLSLRPDGGEYSNFFWPAEQLQAVVQVSDADVAEAIASIKAAIRHD